jgi:hypothetical protein
MYLPCALVSSGRSHRLQAGWCSATVLHLYSGDLGSFLQGDVGTVILPLLSSRYSWSQSRSSACQWHPETSATWDNRPRYGTAGRPPPWEPDQLRSYDYSNVAAVPSCGERCLISSEGSYVKIGGLVMFFFFCICCSWMYCLCVSCSSVIYSCVFALCLCFVCV